MLAFWAMGVAGKKRDAILQRECCPSPPAANNSPDPGGGLGAHSPFLKGGVEADKRTVPGPGSSLWPQKGKAEKDASLSLPTKSKTSKTRHPEPLKQMPAKQSAFGEQE